MLWEPASLVRDGPFLQSVLELFWVRTEMLLRDSLRTPLSSGTLFWEAQNHGTGICLASGEGFFSSTRHSRGCHMTGHRGLDFTTNSLYSPASHKSKARHSPLNYFLRSVLQMAAIWEPMLLSHEPQGHLQTRHFLLVRLSSIGFVLISL